MTLQRIFEQHRAEILDKWQTLLMDTYPEETKRFLKREKDAFANPVGARFDVALEKLLQAFIEGANPASWESGLDEILRVRAVQDFPPSQAVGFIAGLKGVLRAAAEKWGEGTMPVEIRTFEERVDLMVLAAFDIYSRCRQELYEIRVKEVTRQVERLLRRAGVSADEAGEAPAGPEKVE